MTAATLKVLKYLLESPAPVWGLQVVKGVQLPSGSIYPILKRLEKLGVVDSSWEVDEGRVGARRRFYAITPSGIDLVESILAESKSISPTTALEPRLDPTHGALA